MESVIKAAKDQVSQFDGPKIVVFDLSYCREVCDMLALNGQVIRDLLTDFQDRHSRLICILAYRFCNLHFGRL
jgi:hypothetical protein